ncbi:hypothetical protein ACU4GD_28665 [Cupriavidus basilensis]
MWRRSSRSAMPSASAVRWARRLPAAASSTARVVCIAGGTGLAPILSILRGMARCRHAQSRCASTLASARRRTCMALEWLRELQARHAALHVHVVVASASDDSSYRGGVVTEAVADDWAHMGGWRAYLAGAPRRWSTAASILLRQAGIDPEHIHADAFHASGV